MKLKQEDIRRAVSQEINSSIEEVLNLKVSKIQLKCEKN